MTAGIALPKRTGMTEAVALRKERTMTEGVALPAIDTQSIRHHKPTIFTFVVPAFGGCEFDGCKAWCGIEQMMERIGHPDPVGADDYMLFARGLLSGWHEQGGRVIGWTVQGHRPFREDSLPYTRRLLEIGAQAGVPLSVIDVGRNIPENLPWLNALSIAPALHISFDGGKEAHDKRQAGAFDESVVALQATLRYPRFRNRTYIAFTLMPGKVERLIQLMDELPIAARSIPIVVSPYLDWGSDEPGGPVDSGQAFLQAFADAKAHADHLGFTLEIDDEFDALELDETGELFKDVIVRKFTECDVLRVLPNLQMLVGTQILTQVTRDTPQWEPPARFVAGLFEQQK